jgi:hypothetical protein
VKQSAYAKARDQRVAEEVVEDVHLMCSAKGCPRRWTVLGDRGKACSAHYWRDPADWPRITAMLQRQDVERAMEFNPPEPPPEPMTREQRVATLAELSRLGRIPADPKAWAKRLRDRHKAGEKLKPSEIDAYRNALPYDGWHEGDNHNEVLTHE